MDKMILGDYGFSAEYNDKVVESPKLNVIDGIRLFPMRFGIYRKSEDARKDTYPSENYRALDGAGNSIPVMDSYGYNLNPMILSDGWLYVYSNARKSVYIYHCVNNYYTLTEIKKLGTVSGKEIMAGFLKHTFDYIPLHSDDTVLLYYSLVELSDRFIEFYYNNTQLKNGDWLGSKFSCKAWSEGTTESEVTRRTVDVDSIFFMMDKMSAKDPHEDAIADDFKKRIEAAKVQHREKKTKFRDVFFVLDDPLGCLEKITCELNDARLYHEGLIRSIRTGVAPDIIKYLLGSIVNQSSGEKKQLSTMPDLELFENHPEEQKKQIEQAQYIHTLAHCFYHCVYGKEENHLKDNEDGALNRESLEKLLAVTERAESLAKVENLRKLFATYVNSPIFTRFCEHFSIRTADIASDKKDEEHAEMKFAVQKEVISLLRAFIPIPHIKDKELDLPEKYEKYKDSCAELLDEIFKAIIGDGKNKVGLLFSDIPTLAGLNLDIARDTSSAYVEMDSRKVDITVSSAFLFIDNFVNSFWRPAYEVQKTKLLLSKFKIDPEELMIEFDKGEVTKELSKNGRVRQDPDIIEGRGNIRIKLKTEDDLTKPIYIKTVAKNPSKYKKLFKRMTSSKTYLGILSMFQLWSILDEDWKENSSWKTVSKSVGFVSSVGVIQRRFVESSLELHKTAVTKRMTVTQKISARMLERVQMQMTVLGAVGMIADGFCSFLDGMACWDKNDKDAGTFYYLAAFASGVGGIYILVALIFKLAAAGPVGIICAIVTLISVIIASCIIDSDFEAFIKRTVLHKDVLGKLSGEPHWRMFILSKQEQRESPFADGYDDENDIHKKALVNYKYQLEEFMYTQMLFPFFAAEISYIQDNSLADYRFRLLRPRPSFDEVRFVIKSNITQQAMGLWGIQICALFIKKREFRKNGIKVVYPSVVTRKKENDFSEPLYPYNSGSIMTESEFQYSVRERTSDVSLFGGSDLYVVLLIRFIHNDGRITPMNRDQKNTYLVYRYQIDIPSKVGNSKILLYNEAKAKLKKIFISPYNEKVWNF